MNSWVARTRAFFLFPAFALLALFLATLPTTGAHSQSAPPYQPGDWPMYGHDQSRTSYNPDEYVISASNVAQLVSRWQSPDLAPGAKGLTSSGPVVANGKVFVGSAAPSGDNFFAFDAVTGKQLWSTNLNYNDQCYGVGIGATAAVSGTLLVAGGGDDAYYGIDTETGTKLWRFPLNEGASAYPWASPIIANGRVYVGAASGCDNPSVRGGVIALDLQGHLVASQYFVPADQAGAGIWNSAALTPDGKTLVVATGEDFNGYDGPYNRAIVSMDASSLAIQQAFKEGQTDVDQDFGTSPVVFRDDQNRTLVGANHKNGIFYTFALGSIDKGPTWSRTLSVRIGILPAYDPSMGAGGTLFVQSKDNGLFAVNPATGNDRWPATPGDGRGNMAVANGLIFLNNKGNLQILDESTGKTLRTITPDNAGGSNSGVAVSHGFVYWNSGSHLNAWSLPAGVQVPTPTPTAAPQIPGNQFETFPQTGQTVSGIFLDYWHANGGLPQQGFPITSLMQEVSDLNSKPYTVQYFERAVFEYHPENKGTPYEVLLSQLGTFQYKEKYPNGAPGQKANTDPGSVLFPQTGHHLGGKFLDYWRSHGGVAQQGYPISEEFTEVSDLDGKPYTVQYFERAVFEWHPENQPPYDVLLSQLGTIRHRAKSGGK